MAVTRVSAAVALRHPEIRRIEIAWGLSVVSVVASTVALFVFAFDAGGAGLVALCGVASMVPAAIATPILTALGDTVAKDRMLRLLTAVRATLLGAAAACVAVDSPTWVIIVAVSAATALAPSFRPVQAAALPWLARTPAELTAASVTATLAENLGALIGPLLTGLALALAGVSTALMAAAGCTALALLSLLRLSIPQEPTAPVSPASRRAFLRDIGAGAAAIARLAPPAGLLVLGFVQPFVRGALGVVIVVLALEDLHIGDSGVGWLNGAIGLGGVLGAVTAGLVLRMTRLGRCFAAALVLWGLAVVALSGAETGALAFGALFVVGLANAVEDGAMFTLLPRMLGAGMAGRGLGALELVILLGAGAGTVSAPALVGLLGTRGCLTVLGTVLAGLAAAYFLRFGYVDRALPDPPPEVELLRGLPMFAALPLVTIERLALDLEPHQFANGEVVVREGEPGGEFHVIAAGEAAVSLHGVRRPSLSTGDGFGEIALLHDIPRTATVTAENDLRTLTLNRDRFLAAVTGNPVSRERADALAARRLSVDRLTEPG